ncbi:MAG TPA: PQQ-dependent dehydrogenase, methanol/ethanol family [Burkholderiaceae bacterium]|nr:PQQ-dependent dehydrogenase, methanol/ethanol family [Burkholderiaceae bacterium]
MRAARDRRPARRFARRFAATPRSALLAGALAASLAACATAPGRDGAAPTSTAVLGTTSAGEDAGTRFDTLGEIGPANVARLALAWRVRTGTTRGEEGAPLIVGDLLVLHAPLANRVVALGLADRAIRWTYERRLDPGVPAVMCCDVVSRGMAAGRGKIFVQQADATLVALDARTGAPLWTARNGDPRAGATATNAPRLFDRYVVTGIAGGEYGVRGYVSAFDAETGALAWRGYSVGPDAEMLIDAERTTTWADGRVQSVGAASSLHSWTGEAWRTGGGTTWGWYAYDASLRLVYYGTGNPSTWNAAQRPGDNRWASSLFARDIDTGRVRWVYQMTPHDEWDYDGVNESILFDGPDAAGRSRRMLAHFDRNGFAYVLDRETGELLQAKAYDPSVNWATAIDLASGKPVRDARYSTERRDEDETTANVCPPAIGSKNQAPAAFDPDLKLFYVPAIHLCMDFERFHADYAAGQPYVGASVRMHPVRGDEGTLGRLVAWDAIGGRAAWVHPEAAPLWGGVLATRTGLVFYGTLDGHLKALDARTGALLWTSEQLPSGVVGNVISWSYGGRQFVGVLVGIGGLANDPDGIGKLAPAMPSGAGEFVAFALP